MRAPGESARSPRTDTVPASGMTRPTMLRIRVLLPAPLGPSNPRHSPSFNSNVTPLTAVKSPKRLTSPSIRKGHNEDGLETTGADAIHPPGLTIEHKLYARLDARDCDR